MKKDFLTLLDLTSADLSLLLEYSILLKKNMRQGLYPKPLQNKVLAMIFEKSSTRTRLAFETAMYQLGGHAIFLSNSDSQLGRNESLNHTAQVTSRMVDIISVRTFAHKQLEEFAHASRVPVINALTDSYHPCQILADIQTYIEYRGSIHGAKVVWIGDGNNMCNSYINAAQQFGFHLNIACPLRYMPNSDLTAANQANITMFATEDEAVAGANLVVTDTWASMGDEDEHSTRLKDFAHYQVDPELLAKAHQDVLLMHCLPAHEGEEVSNGLLENHPASVVFDEAENRLHAQKALLVMLLRGKNFVEQEVTQNKGIE